MITLILYDNNDIIKDVFYDLIQEGARDINKE
jgi:hypothetical protein